MSVQTTIVSMNGSSPATTPSLTGSRVRAAEWAIGEDPCPDSLEKRARFIPQRKAVPAAPPMKAPSASDALKAVEKIDPKTSGSALILKASTTRAMMT